MVHAAAVPSPSSCPALIRSRPAAAAIVLWLLACASALAKEGACEPIRPDDTFEIRSEFPYPNFVEEFDEKKWKEQGADFYEMRRHYFSFFVNSERKPEPCIEIL